jgi:hypothetical protein
MSIKVHSSWWVVYVYTKMFTHFNRQSAVDRSQ